MTTHICPLCQSQKTTVCQKAPFYECAECKLVFKDSSTHLSAQEEMVRYQQHQNSLENEGYVKFLTPVVELVKKHVDHRGRILDYGCGPGPVLAELLQREEFKSFRYDPFFYSQGLDNIPPLDAVTCTEVAEHFFSPGKEFEKIFSLLKPEGVLVLMTETLPKDQSLEDWYYTKDPTHVCFYASETLQYIARKYGKSLHSESSRLFVFA